MEDLKEEKVDEFQSTVFLLRSYFQINYQAKFAESSSVWKFSERN